MNQRSPSAEWIRIFSVTSLLAVIVISCSDEPNAVGIGVLPPEDSVSVDMMVIREATSTTFKQFISPNDVLLLIGTYRGYEARTLIRFNSLPDSLEDARVLTATLRLNPSYTFGDSSTQLSFSVHTILHSWTETSATWDSVDTAFYDPTPHGDFAQIVSDTTEIEVGLDTTLAKEWLIAAATDTDQFGVVLLPTPELSVIKGFGSFQSGTRPTLEIVYEHSGRRDTVTSIEGADLFIADVDLEQKPELMLLQAGVTYRSRLRFDVSALDSNAIVHNATLELTIDSSASELEGSGTVSVVVHHVSDSTTNDFEPLNFALSLAAEDNPNLLEVNVTRNLQRWVLGEPNHGMLLRASTEANRMDLITIFSPRASEENYRPRLTVLYSPIPR